MKYYIQYLLCFVFLSSIQIETKGQLLLQEIFSDSTRISGFDEIHEVLPQDDGYILSASVLYPQWEEVLIIKVDENGESIWSTSPFQEVRIDKVLRSFKMIEDENYIYAACNYRDTGGGEVDFWKVDKLTGEVKWIYKYHPTESPYADTFLQGDEWSFLWIWKSGNSTKISRISKIDGQEVQTTVLSDYIANGFSMTFAVDRLGHLYAAYYGEIIKYKAPEYEEILWKFSIDETINTEYIDRIYFDKSNNLFLFDNRTVHRLNPWTGKRYWKTNVSIYATEVEGEILDLGEDLMYAARHYTVGSGSSNFNLVRMSKEDGEAIFDAAHSMIGPYGSVTGNWEGVLALGLDCEGNALVTGYYGQDNFGPGNWGMMKINASTGEKLSEQTFTLYPEQEDDSSQGEFIHARNGIPTMLGEAQLGGTPFNNAAHLVKLDPFTNEVSDFVELDAGYRHESATVYISSNNDDIYVLKEIGKNLISEKRSSNGELLWSREFNSDSKLLNGFVSATEQGVLVYFSRSIGELDTIPWYSSDSDSLTFTYLNYTDGSILLDTTFVSPFSTGRLSVLQAIFEQDKFFIFLNRPGNLNTVFRWDIQNQTIATSNGFENFTEGEYEFQPMVNYDLNTIRIIGSNSVRSINKNTLTGSNLLTWTTRPARDVMQWGDTVYVAGHYSNNLQSLTAYRLSTNIKLWEVGYTNPGSWYQVTRGANNQLYAVGISNGAFRVARLNRQNGLVLQDFYPQNAQWENLVPGAISFYPPNHLLINATNERSDGGSDPMLLLVDMMEMEIDYVWSGPSPTDRRSIAKALLVDANNMVWTGGSWFSAEAPYGGYLNIHDLNTLNQEQDCPGDFNGDDLVNSADLLYILVDQGCMGDCLTDLNGNGMADTADLIMWLSLGFGTCP